MWLDLSKLGVNTMYMIGQDYKIERLENESVADYAFKVYEIFSNGELEKIECIMKIINE